MDYSCCFGLSGNLDFLDFHQKKFYNINYCFYIPIDDHQTVGLKLTANLKIILRPII